MPTTKKSTFGTRLNLMRRVFQINQRAHVLTTAFTNFLPADPRRVWFQIFVEGSPNVSMFLRIIGNSHATGLNLAISGSFCPKWSVEDDFSFVQVGVEARHSGVPANVQSLECIYIGG